MHQGITVYFDRQRSEICYFKATNCQEVLYFNICHIFILCSKFVTDIWTRLFSVHFSFILLKKNVTHLTLKTVSEKSEEGTFEQVGARLVHLVRLLYKSKTCSSLVTILSPCLTSSHFSFLCIPRAYLLLLPVLPWRPRSAAVGSFAIERREQEQGPRDGLSLAGVQGARLASVAALGQVFSSCRRPIDGLSFARTAFER